MRIHLNLSNLKVAISRRINKQHQLVYEVLENEQAIKVIMMWTHYEIPAFQAFAKTVISHWNGIVHFVESRLTNGILEGINHKVQLAKRRARGYRNIDNFIHMIYFLCGKLQFTYPRYFT